MYSPSNARKTHKSRKNRPIRDAAMSSFVEYP